MEGGFKIHIKNYNQNLNQTENQTINNYNHLQEIHNIQEDEVLHKIISDII